MSKGKAVERWTRNAPKFFAPAPMRMEMYKEKQKEKKAEEAAALARTPEEPAVMPIKDTEQEMLARKRAAAASRKRGGRMSTILTRGGETLG